MKRVARAYFFWYDQDMDGKSQQKTLIECWIGKMLAVLLASLWLISMSTVDSNAYSSMPAYVGLAFAAALAGLGLLSGYRVVRLGWLNWLALGTGCYYLGRCMLSYAQVESWSEMALILGCMLFYVGGVYAVQGRGGRRCLAILAVGLAINLIYMVLMRLPEISILWTGRPPYSLSGAVTRPTALFAYKNWAALFLCGSGAVLVWHVVWVGRWRVVSLLLALVGVLGVVASFFCESRSMGLGLALALVTGWLIWVMIRLNSGEKMGAWALGGGLVLGIGLLVLFCDFIWGGTLLGEIADWDSHLRYQIWKGVTLAAQQAPLWGWGARATEWEIIPYFSEFALPNFAHNEYLQAWLDYGVVGVGLLVFVVVSHLAAGIWFMSVDGESRDRRVAVGGAMLWLVVMAGGAAVDYVWHQYALAVMTAFACGMMASPSVHPSHVSDRGLPSYTLRYQGILGRLVLAAGCLLVVMLCVLKVGCLLRPWKAQWEYAEMVGRGASPQERCRYLLPLLFVYPDSRVADEYMRLGQKAELPFCESEAALRQVLRYNPRQLYTATMLANLLSQQKRFREADALLREYYPGDGPDGSCLSSWPAFYGLNLLYWGYQRMGAGESALALSMMDYALNMNAREWLGVHHDWQERIKVQLPPNYRYNQNAYLQARMMDVRTMKAVGIVPDDSWQEPYRKGGKPALYQRWGKIPPDKPQQGKIISLRPSS